MRCEGCPWPHAPIVESIERRVGAIVCIVGEGPAREEVARGMCFVGPSGRELDKTLNRAGIDRRECAITNAHACARPEGATPKQEVEAVEACREGLWGFLSEVKPKSLVLLGGRALRAVAPGFVASALSDGLMRHRGSLWSWSEVEAANSTLSLSMTLPGVRYVMATIHPAAIIRREKLEGFPAMGYRMVPALDVKRVVEAVGKGRTLAPIERAFGAPPWRGEPFCIDIETRSTTDRMPEWVGVQHLEAGGPVYGGPWVAMRDWIGREMGGSALKVAHNGLGFDFPLLIAQGIEVREPYADTMSMAGMCESDMARGLAYNVAYYMGHQRPFYKDVYRADVRPETRRALRAAWSQTGIVPQMFMDGEWSEWANALDVDSTRLIYGAMLARGRREGWTS